MQVSKSFPEGCTFFDVVLQCYSSLNLMPKFIIDNNIKDLNLITRAGQTFIFDNDFIDDEFISNEAATNDYKYCTGKVPPFNRLSYILTESGEILSSETNELFLR
jgi:hypothetical protein